MERKTPLYESHVELGGKIVPFAGYLLPVQYKEGVIAEHMAVRTKAGLFDVSHMGEVLFTGKDALANIQMLVSNDCSKMKPGQVKYSPICNEAGGIIDDLLVYKITDERYMLVINAANRNKDVDWFKSKVFGDVSLRDVSNDIAQIALQGPKSVEILKKLADESSIPAKYYTFIEKSVVGGVDCIVSNTGYTGESGFEFYCSADVAEKLWNSILEAGKDEGLIPCGLGARDTLRLEASMPLYGHEMTDEITPLEADLSFAVKLTKDDFYGKQAIIDKSELTRKRIGLKITGKGIAREDCKVFSGEKEVGFTTSGTMCPYIGYAIAMAIVDIPYTELGTQVEVDVRGRKISAEVVPMPFYKRDKN